MSKKIIEYQTAFGVSCKTKAQLFCSFFRFTRMVEVGVAHREKRLWKTKKPACERTVANSGAVTFFEVVPSLCFLSAGILLSLLVFLIELLTIQLQQKRHQLRPGYSSESSYFTMKLYDSLMCKIIMNRFYFFFKEENVKDRYKFNERIQRHLDHLASSWELKYLAMI